MAVRRILLVWFGLVVLWLFLAGIVLPVLVRGAYADPGFPILGQMLSGRDDHPVGWYLDVARGMALRSTLWLFAISAMAYWLMTPRVRGRINALFARSSVFGVRDTILLGVCAGVLFGWAEASARTVAGRVVRLPPLMPGAEIFWTTPVINAFLAVCVALLVCAVSRGWRGVPLRFLVLFFVFFGAYGFVSSARAGIHPLAIGAIGLGAGLQLSAAAGEHPERLKRLVRRASPVLAVLVAVIAAAVPAGDALREARARSQLQTAPAAATNVLFLILDTVRASSLSLYEYARSTSPSLERWARRGVTFAMPIAPSSWTLPTHASLFTGLWPSELGLDRRRYLGHEAPTLAEVLAARGYATAGFVANLHYTTRASGLDRGFAHYEDHPLSLKYAMHNSRWLSWIPHRMHDNRWDLNVGYKPAADLNDDFLRWLSSIENRPFFAFLNYADAHRPRLQYAPFDTLFSDALPHGPAQRTRGFSIEEIIKDQNDYDRAIAYLDHHIGRLLGEMERRGALERTVVVITSDHGEHFGEHGLYLHGNSLYMPLVHVPLVMIGPSIPAGARVDEPVSLRNLPATILDLALSDAPAMPGHSLRPLWTPSGSDGVGAYADLLGEGSAYAELLGEVGVGPTLQTSRLRAPLQSLVTGNLQYIRDVDAREQLFDLAADPRQRAEVAGPERDRQLEVLRRLLDAHPRSSAPHEVSHREDHGEDDDPPVPHEMNRFWGWFLGLVSG
ncbi:MAG: sulfatase [Longimicrobiales bacterium]